MGFIAFGFALSLFGLVLVFKVIDYVYLNVAFNVNVAVAGFFLALTIFLIGGFMVIFHL